MCRNDASRGLSRSTVTRPRYAPPRRRRPCTWTPAMRALPVVPLAVLTTFAIGLRHGLDWDHIAAITDITGAELRRRRAAALALLYAAGHGVMVFALGLAAVAAGGRLPPWIDPAMERIVGATILILAVTLLRSLRRGAPGPRSRGVVLSSFLARTRDRFRHDRVLEVEHEHSHDHVGMHRHEPAIVPSGDTVR